MSTPSSRPIQLTDAQRQVLSAAAGQADSALTLPARLKGNAARALAKSLLDKGLAREVRAKGDLPTWRRDADTDRAFTLVLTKAGRAAVPQAAVIPEQPAERAPAPAAGPAPEASIAMPPRPGSTLAEIVALLRRDGGISVDELRSVTGWLPHTTRAALTGLRKRGYAVTRQAAGTGSLYSIAQTPAAA